MADAPLTPEKTESTEPTSLRDLLKPSSWPSTATVKEVAGKLYDAETRPGLVANGLTKCGAEKIFDAKSIGFVASLSTVSGLLEQKAAFAEMAGPYINKAYNPEGRKELVSEAAELASTKVIQPTRDFAAPYVSPYLSKFENKRAEIVSSKRYEKAVAALQQVREHPMELASEFKSKAIDLLKYEKLMSYREYVMSPEFQADTRRLVQVELPAIASDAASRGVHTLKHSANALAETVETRRAQVTTALERGYSAVKKVELDDLRARAKSLVGELQNEVSEGVSLAREKGFSASDAIARVKKVVAAIDSLFISGILTLADEPSKPADMNGGADSSMEVAPGSPAPTGGAATGADSIDADADDRDSLLSESAINRLGPI
uniref:Uncharacterized protein n=1 Tax=Chrysotila carterae TaxID=13221 RepID=A0A7S4BLZ6_CHRCT